MNRPIFFVAAFLLSSMLYGQENVQEDRMPDSFFRAVGINVLSNTLLHLADRYISQDGWAQVTPASIRENLTVPWQWDGDQYFINQFGHPYQGSIYHAAARSNGFLFYEAMLFDTFGSVYWELFCETNTPSINDLISTTLGGAALGEMFHRLYLEIANPLGLLVSPADALNNMITRRRPQRTNNIYSLRLAFGIGYTYAGQAIEQDNTEELLNLNIRHIVSTDIACTVIYGNPFVQQSKRPYEHFEIMLYAHLGYPFWYNLKLLSDAYLFSFSVFDRENKQASTGLSLHYDLFADRQIDFFSQALDWTYKYKKHFRGGTEMEFKGHIGWTVFNADTFYVHNEYSGLRKADNNYGTGANMKLIFSAQNQHRKGNGGGEGGIFEIKVYVYEVFNVFKNENSDSGRDFFMFINADYSFPIGKQVSIGVSASLLWHHAYYDRIPDTQKLTNDAKLYIAWKR
ncbi:MAG: DUF3943 domain-containing protein [Spirochaetaceae bacterium]|jgi:hypothetical protein|nr:DUF3943 domain-containing protein [Spirochaetaceae bacterium]